MLDFPSYGVFLMTLIVSANFLAETFPCKIQYLLKNSMYFKHFFGFLTMMFFVILTIPNRKIQIKKLLFDSVMLYVGFILLGKTHSPVFFIIFSILCIIYILELMKNEKKDKIMENEGDYNTYKKLEFYQNILKYLSIVLLIIGVLSYMGDKKLEYKKNFNYELFIVGKQSCNNDVNNLTVKSFFTNILHIFD